MLFNRGNFWRQYRFLRRKFPKDISFSIFTLGHTNICITSMLDDADLGPILGFANDAERLSQAPWKLLPGIKCDEGKFLGWCRWIWAAKSDWQESVAEEERRKAKQK